MEKSDTNVLPSSFQHNNLDPAAHTYSESSGKHFSSEFLFVRKKQHHHIPGENKNKIVSVIAQNYHIFMHVSYF